MLQLDPVRKLKLDATLCEFWQVDDLILHRESPLLKNRSDATGDFKNERGIGSP
jgi:hypothetical protein